MIRIFAPYRFSIVSSLAVTLFLTVNPDVFAQASGRNSSAVHSAFKEVVSRPSESTVRILCNDKEAALGTIVSPDGYIVTKGSLLKGKLVCRLKDGRSLAAKYIGVEDRHDIALLKINASGLKPIVWNESKNAEPGNWLASPGIGTDPVAVGVVSVATRKTTPRDFPRPAPAPNSGFLGILLQEGEGNPIIARVEEGSAAEKAGLKVGDIVLSVAGRRVASPDTLVLAIQRFKVGDEIILNIMRGKEQKSLLARLGKRPTSAIPVDRSEQMNRMGSELSDRRSGFPVILQHDTVIKPTDCGGPIVDLDGKAVGINIARAGRIESYAIPSETILSMLSELKAGKYPPPDEDAMRVVELTRKLEGYRTDLKKAEIELATLNKTSGGTEDDEKELKTKRKALADQVGKLRKSVSETQNELDTIRKDRTKK